MFNYYSAVIVLSWMALLVLCVLISENDRITEEDKKSFYLTYVLIASSALAEWLGVYFSGNATFPAWAIRLIKCADYILTPMAGGSLVRPMHKNTRRGKALQYVLGFNIAFQAVSFLTGWMTRIDEAHRYSDGPLYPVYILIYLTVMGLVIYDFFDYGRAFRHQNKTSLYSIMILVFAGIVLQEISSSEIRTAYLAMTLGAGLLFIHFTEYSQLEADDALIKQRELIMTDTLTGVNSRYAYTEALNQFSSGETVPEDLVSFTIDINGLKKINDRFGHEAGDELIIGAAQCIRETVNGKCYRTGGDEFVVLGKMNQPEAEEALKRLKEKSDAWRGEKVSELSLSAGYALAKEHPGHSAEELVRESDLSMYEAKAEYYRKSGRDRRRR